MIHNISATLALQLPPLSAHTGSPTHDTKQNIITWRLVTSAPSSSTPPFAKCQEKCHKRPKQTEPFKDSKYLWHIQSSTARPYLIIWEICHDRQSVPDKLKFLDLMHFQQDLQLNAPCCRLLLQINEGIFRCTLRNAEHLWAQSMQTAAHWRETPSPFPSPLWQRRRLPFACNIYSSLC